MLLEVEKVNMKVRNWTIQMTAFLMSDLNTGENVGVLWRLAVIWSPVKVTSYSCWENPVSTNNKKERLLAKTKKCTTTNWRMNRNWVSTTARTPKWEEKQLNGYFRRQIEGMVDKSTWTWLHRGNLKWETELLWIAAQNNTIRTNYINVKTDKKKCWTANVDNVEIKMRKWIT